MPKLDAPPEYIRDSFRKYLIEHGGASGITGLGYSEEIKRFRFYLETFEQFISRQESAEIALLEADAEKFSDEGKSEFLSWYYPVHWDEIFRTNLRSSFLISLVSMIESQLMEVCRDVAVIARTPIQVSDLKGSFFERAQLFLIKFSGFQKPTDEAWGNLYRIYDVRNVFVHYVGYLPSYRHNNRVRQFIQASGGLKETNGILTITPEFCPSVLDVTQLFLCELFNELSLLCARVRTFEDPTK